MYVQSKADHKNMLGLGITELNLACSGHPDVALEKGGYCLFIGGSESGKTWLALQALAEAANNKNFDDYQLVLDNAENGARMDIGRFFGSKLDKRLEYGMDPESQEPSRLIEEFYHYAHKRMDDGPFVGVLDSNDALDCRENREHMEALSKEVEGGKDAGGDYGAQKAKFHSKNIMSLNERLIETGSILIIICQERDKMNAGQFESKVTFSGGRALKFYAQMQIWLKTGSQIKKTVDKVAHRIGNQIKFSIHKNRNTGGHGQAEAPFYPTTGFADVDSCIDYLCKTGRWSGGSKIKAPDLDVHFSKDKLIRHIEENNLEDELQLAVYDQWKKIAERCAVTRKSRYE